MSDTDARRGLARPESFDRSRSSAGWGYPGGVWVTAGSCPREDAASTRPPLLSFPPASKGGRCVWLRELGVCGGQGDKPGWRCLGASSSTS